MLSVRCDRHLLPSTEATRRVRVDLRMPELERTSRRPPLCLGLVLDRSGSMQGQKLALTQEAAIAALRALQPGDSVSVVSYADDVKVLVPATAVSRAAIERSVAALHTLRADGWTDLGAGWLSGCAQVGEAVTDSALGRCLLLTDGLANRGITDPHEILRHAAELRRRGVTTSTLGVGYDFDESLLRRLADAAGGHFYYASGAAEIPSMVATELNAVLEVAAREARVWVRCAPQVSVTSLNDDPCSQEDGRVCIQLGSLRAGELRSIVLELRFPSGPIGETQRVGIALSDRDSALAAQECWLSFVRVSDAEVESEAPEVDVVREAARLEGAAARVRAVEQLRLGESDAALASIDAQLERLRKIAGDDAVLLELIRGLEADREAYARPYYSPAGKLMHFRAYQSLKQRPAFSPDALDARTIALLWFDPGMASLVIEAYKALQPEAANAGVKLIASAAPSVLRFSGADRGPVTRDEERLMVEAVAGPALTVAYTLRQLHDNWFSHWHPERRIALVSLHGWDFISSIQCSALIAYEGLLYGLRVLSQQYDPNLFLHRETRGCLYDFCERKEEVEIKLQAGHICEPCCERLTALGLDPAVVARAWSRVQQLAHPPSSAQPLV